MAFQSSSGTKRKLNDNDDDDDVDLIQDETANIMNPAKRHTESQRIKNTDFEFESLAADDESDDSQYEYTLIDDDKNNEEFIPIQDNIIKTKRNTNNNDEDNDIDIHQFVNNDDDNDLNVSTHNQQHTEIKKTALGLNWSDDDDCIDQYESERNNNKIAWFPTQNNPSADIDEKEENMKYDKSAYNVLFEFHTEWPCLSFDVVSDNLGAVRTTIPYSLYLVCGSQADPTYRNDKASAMYRNKYKVNRRIQNKIQFLKLNDIQKTKYDDDKDDINEEKDDEYIHMTDDDPVLQNRDIFHPSIVNRIRNKRINEQYLVATMGSDCNLYIWNGTQHILSLDGLCGNLDLITQNREPICTSLHSDEGYGLAWNCMGNEPSLLTGSCVGELRLYEAKSSGFVRTIQFKTLKASIEDISWSPQHCDIFASVGVDKCIRIWDKRSHSKQHVARIQNAHKYDINVCSWNPHSDHQHLLLTGSDDHSFKIWDLRKLSSKSNASGQYYNKQLKKCAHYYLSKWHLAPITSIEWSPNDASVAIVSSEDHQISIWDFSLERDDSITNTGAKFHINSEDKNSIKIPPQLTFLHCGQRDVKEVHFHPQIPNLCISTSGHGFHLFQPDNLMESFRNDFQNMTLVD